MLTTPAGMLSNTRGMKNGLRRLSLFDDCGVVCGAVCCVVCDKRDDNGM